MKKERQLTALMGTYSAILLIVCILSIYALYTKKTDKSKEIRIETVIETKEIYVLVESSESSTLPQEDSICFVVKEYDGKIGVFDTKGTLLNIIDVYTKTLPKADQTLLREGIGLKSEDELRALIEDYSS